MEKELAQVLNHIYGKSIEAASNEEIYMALLTLSKEKMPGNEAQ